MTVAAACAMAMGCAAADGEDEDGEDAAATFAEQGVYHYVLNFDLEHRTPVFGGAHRVVTDAAGKAEAIDQANQPSRLHPQLQQHMVYDPALTSGETDWPVFASSYWPMKDNGIAHRWNRFDDDYQDLSPRDDLSPVEKYDLLFHPGQPGHVPAVRHAYANDEPQNTHEHPAMDVAGPATAWEIVNHGTYHHYSHPDDWWGHCNGWAAYVTTEPDGIPDREIRVTLVNGRVTECTGPLQGAPDCLLLRPIDIEALMTELHYNDSATLAGRACRRETHDMERDAYGRPVDPACRDLNPGAFHVALTGLLASGVQHMATQELSRPSFIIDFDLGWEVHNSPVVSYEILAQNELSAEQANGLLGAVGSTYVFNQAARRFVEIELAFWMVHEALPDSEFSKHASQRVHPALRVPARYVLELDEAGRILGGEWLRVPSVLYGEVEFHPDFFWMATDHVGYEEDLDDGGGTEDNPYVSYANVRALLDCANNSATCAP